MKSLDFGLVDKKVQKKDKFIVIHQTQIVRGNSFFKDMNFFLTIVGILNEVFVN